MITFACETWDQSTKDIGGKLYSPVVPQVLLNSSLLLPQFCKGMTWECSWLARKSVSGSWRLWLSLSTKDTAEVLSCSVSKLNVMVCIPLFFCSRKVIDDMWKFPCSWSQWQQIENSKAHFGQNGLFCWMGIFINKIANSFHVDSPICGSASRNTKSRL